MGPSSGTNIGAIAGGVVGGITALTALTILGIFLRHGKQNLKKQGRNFDNTQFLSNESHHITPFEYNSFIQTQDQPAQAQPSSSNTNNASSHQATEDRNGSGIRNELEQLRREMEEIRTGITCELPPNYSS